MEELIRIGECLQTLQDAPSAPVQPLNYSEFLVKMQELKRDVKDQLNRVRAFNFKARQLKESMRQEIPIILKLCYENPSKDLGGDTQRDDLDIHPGTPVMPTPRPPQKRGILNTGVGITTPRRNTPLSLSKSLLQHKFSARCSPAAFSKFQFRGTPVKTTRAPVECTPQMPSRTFRKKPVGTMSSASTVSNGRRVQEAGPSDSQLRIPETTPQMKERVSFFSNPNAANIHQRYVAIQDQDADESTCLLGARVGQKTSNTPEFPMSTQKKPQTETPAHRGEVTPPLPVSTSKRVLLPSIAMPTAPRSEKKNIFDRTPSPPRSARNGVRRCLETKTTNSPIACDAFRQVDSNVAHPRPEHSRPFEPSLSVSELLPQHESSVCCSPAASAGLQFRRTPAKTTQALLECTPEMPSRTSRRKPIGATVSTLSKGRRVQEAPKSLGPSDPQLRIPETTPEMKERVSFFSNPNAANIHQRYVAIQDQDADESTCLLGGRVGPKTSNTPEFPMSTQKKPQSETPAHRGDVTPPLPISVTKKALLPPTEPRSEKKINFDLPPSPPRSPRNGVRRCLEAKTTNLQIACDALRQVDLNRAHSRPEVSRQCEPRALTQPLSKIGISTNQTTASRTTFETPSLKGQNRTLGSKTITETTTSMLQNSALRDNMNSSRKKPLLTNLEKTPNIPKSGKSKATPKPKLPVCRASTMPLNIENVTLPLRPSKMLRNKTVAS